MNKSLYFAAVFFAVLAMAIIGFSALSSNLNGSDRQNEIIIRNTSKTSGDGTILIDGNDAAAVQPPTVTSRRSIIEAPRSVADGSQISTMYDGFGNKTEIRTFSNNLLVHSITVRTFTDGRRRIFVYGQNGDVRSLPEDSYEKVLTDSGNSLANSAGIFTGRVVPTPPQRQELAESSPNPPVSDTPPQTNQTVETSEPQITDAPQVQKEKDPSENDKKARRRLLSELQNSQLKGQLK